jgi:hypothetical protein
MTAGILHYCVPVQGDGRNKTLEAATRVPGD